MSASIHCLSQNGTRTVSTRIFFACIWYDQSTCSLVDGIVSRDLDAIEVKDEKEPEEGEDDSPELSAKEYLQAFILPDEPRLAS